MRILFVTQTYLPDVTGAAIATNRTIVQLRNRGHELFVVAHAIDFSEYNEVDNGVVVYRVRSIQVERYHNWRLSPRLFHYCKLRTVIEEIRPDIVHINNPGCLAVSALRLSKQYRIPIVGTGHFMPENITHYFYFPQPILRLLNELAWKKYARFYSKLDLIICPSPTAAKLLTRSGASNRIIVITNGIDLYEFNHDNDGRYLVNKYYLPEKPILLYVGRLDKEKSIDTFIKAISILKYHFDFHVLIVGDGKEYGHIKLLSKILGLSELVTFTGYMSDYDRINVYNIADLFVMTSVAELQSLAVMEAMACGLPIVGANAVALPHLIHDNVNGFLFNPRDEVDLAEKIGTLLSDKDLLQKMGKYSLSIIADHDIRIAASKLENAYLDVIENTTNANV
jgi:1,2-diacylglycerol 3-alpha-glucosyltransferase